MSYENPVVHDMPLEEGLMLSQTSTKALVKIIFTPRSFLQPLDTSYPQQFDPLILSMAIRPATAQTEPVAVARATALATATVDTLAVYSYCYSRHFSTS